VERLTVYRHFPDEKTLYTACTSHYLALNPPPDPAAWEKIPEAEERLRTGDCDLRVTDAPNRCSRAA
jgi:hypothetical protein